MRLFLAFLACFFITSAIHAQLCIHTGLSSAFTFTTTVGRIKLDTVYCDSCIIRISIGNKRSGKTVQVIQYGSAFLYHDVFKKCENVRSYSTGLHSKVEVLDNDYGDLVVADFNFDGKEDFAVIRESGVTQGPLYSFYIQSVAGIFNYDKYLSETIVYFPEINRKKRTLTTYTLAGAIGVFERIYKQDKLNKWKLVSKKLITD
jgi:hypothetical protein